VKRPFRIWLYGPPLKEIKGDLALNHPKHQGGDLVEAELSSGPAV